MTTETDLDSHLHQLLRLDPESPGRLLSRENSRLEYKERFNWANRAKYAKTLAAFANNSGGFIVFGVGDSPRHLVGVNEDRFDAVPWDRFTAYLNSTYAPELEWDPFSTRLGDVRLGVLYVAPARERPVVALRQDGDVVRESDIFYRYRARSERIRYPELQHILNERQRSERDSWFDHLSRVARIGVENVGILDFVGGELSGRGGRLMVSSDLLEKVQFLREGHFAESDEPGAPTLRVIGDVEPVASEAFAPVRRVPLAIGQRDILLAFLRQERLDAPAEYIKQACRESSPYMPVYYFARWADLSLDGLREFILREPGRNNGLIDRIGGRRVIAVGSLHAGTPHSRQRQDILDVLNAGDIPELRHRDRGRLFEAITHFAPTGTAIHILSLLADVVASEFDVLPGNVLTTCRKAIAHLDEQLNLPSVTAPHPRSPLSSALIDRRSPANSVFPVSDAVDA